MQWKSFGKQHAEFTFEREPCEDACSVRVDILHLLFAILSTVDNYPEPCSYSGIFL